ncbi:cation-transporting ATPase [Rhodococcus sp. SRB_17]|uniref:heavy-metal-associated domain-containing protein n=1 Tax=Rhodococcus sp. OK302 TaxID=1882769 RepID=UPI000B944519|nr:heavy metal-associated domain-containing protein [Rhodococcus sp. OK302]NMM84367.1 cation-transporting ATPase [Rhodococcus sp. SRB_17]OYD66737.1 copper chaperone CopZ [Rhodococcus sp. OK302]
MSTSTVTVSGMTCGPCAASVRKAVGGIAGVISVDVDLASGRVTIDSSDPIDANSIKDAVEGAGFQMTV